MADTLPRHQQAAAFVRARVAAGDLVPGEPAPSAAALARATGFSPLMCRRAVQTLIKDGILIAGPSPHARPRVAGAGDGHPPADAVCGLSAGLAAHRHAAALTQRELAGLIGCSATTVGHAETGRTWQSRLFWEKADKFLNAEGRLLSLHDQYRAAAASPDPHPTPAADPAPALPTIDRVLIIWSDGSTTVALPRPHEP